MKLYIKGEKINIKPINGDSINMVKYWYGESDSYRFATGRKKAEDVLKICPDSFVSGIYTENETIIGLIIGELKKIRETVLWIRTFLIDTAWQRKQYGTYSFNLLCKHASEHLNVKRVYLSVSEENKAGISFWRKMGMSCIKTLEINDSENNSGVFIFEKVL
ncbi:MAG: GNAT family N-acetyltransferase [Clostridiaceae bacterium]|nr:GNAT family N-acetyltransferase [Clostridiaceae bacterium]